MYQRDMHKSNRRRTPSFSSSLLDSIYRSIDGHEEEEEEYGHRFRTLYREKFIMKEEEAAAAARAVSTRKFDKEKLNLRRAIMIESWMEKRRSTNLGSIMYNSTSGSSDSSSRGGGGGGGGVFSSSEAESSYGQRKSRSSSSSTQRIQLEHRINGDNKQTKKKREGGGFTKTKLRALKIYGELKKVRQPISPGGRIASFLNSIFNSGSGKKVKMCSVEAAMEDVSFENDHYHHHRKPKSTCSSSTSSFSRSCLSKTQPKLNVNGATKRSVRFYPVSVIVDEDCRPCGHKCIYEDDPTLMPKIAKSSAINEDLIMTGKDYLATSDYQKKIKNVNELDFRRFGNYIDDDDDDADSCSSSDLFELDHLIGIGRYREELPVYETTNLKTNQAIASGFIH